MSDDRPSPESYGTVPTDQEVGEIRAWVWNNVPHNQLRTHYVCRLLDKIESLQTEDEKLQVLRASVEKLRETDQAAAIQSDLDSRERRAAERLNEFHGRGSF